MSNSSMPIDAPDILCLQETKVINDQFPTASLKKLGYEHYAINGQKSYHGVAILSRHSLRQGRYAQVFATRAMHAMWK